MIFVPFFFFCLTAVSSSLRTMDMRPDCNQEGLDNCKITNCSENLTAVQRRLAPVEPEWDHEQLGVWMDKHDEFVSVMNVTWIIKAGASIHALRGSEINILDESTNQNMCVRYSYKLGEQQNPKRKRWKFPLDGVVVEPRHTYTVTVFNLPEPEMRDNRIRKQITIPGCDDRRIQNSVMCRQNGSLWVHNMTANLSVDKERKMLSIVVSFQAAQYSERYQVSIQSPGLHHSKNVSKENRTSLNVTFEFGLCQLSQCEMLIMVKLGIDSQLMNFTLPSDPVRISLSADEEPPEGFQMQERKRVLIIYSLDHPLYKNIVLKLCAFLATKCGTEVVLDLLDSTRLGMLGSIQWLEWQREQIESSSDKILILCSRGVQAKWRAMCGDRRVFLREDFRSPVGDMLSPALSLMVPHFIRSASFEKYIVAYFDDVCSEDDVPTPFNITVRYKLMKHFEELFFRILDTAKHKPGRVNQIEGLSGDDFYHCPSGRALWDAIEAFRSYQREHPQWFEDELLESSELEAEEPSAEIFDSAKTMTNLITHCVSDSTQMMLSQLKTQGSDFTGDKTGLNMAEKSQMCSSVGVNPLIAENMQPC
uniref:SEFIR domain-containing protein n=1 Tax=Sparus aurata TaxID=8175 RepID=A0A671VCB6_SPAAU